MRHFRWTNRDGSFLRIPVLDGESMTVDPPAYGVETRPVKKWPATEPPGASSISCKCGIDAVGMRLVCTECGRTTMCPACGACVRCTPAVP